MRQLFFALLAISSCCQASSFTSSTSVATGIVGSGFSGLQQGVGFTSGTVTFNGTSVLISATATAQAVANYGVVSLAITATAGSACECGPFGPTGVAEAHASGSFTDTMTIFGGTGIADLSWFFSRSGGVLPTYSLPAQAIFGVPFTISASSAVDLPANSGQNRHVESLFRIEDLFVNGLRNYSFTDESNTHYNLDGTFILTTPEPSTWMLTALAMATLLFLLTVGRTTAEDRRQPARHSKS